MIYETRDYGKEALLFKDWDETLIWSCLQGVMGNLYVNSIENPISAMALLGDFCFFAGLPDEELVLYKPFWRKKDFLILIPRNKRWEEVIERCYGRKVKKVIRYAFKKEKNIFNGNLLRKAVGMLSGEYIMRMIDEDLFWRCRNIPWCEDWVSQYKDYDMYRKYGLGAVILKNGKIVSGASSYAGYIGGIEIEIDTREEYRRKGLAYICGAKLILECVERGLYPSWDAQNKHSAALAEKLGYNFDYEYNAYELYSYL